MISEDIEVSVIVMTSSVTVTSALAKSTNESASSSSKIRDASAQESERVNISSVMTSALGRQVAEKTPFKEITILETITEL